MMDISLFAGTWNDEEKWARSRWAERGDYVFGCFPRDDAIKSEGF